ncbi:hypothetical protein HYX13_03520 [Candidatus Woesearchaeota archaeon]|nr:hypothetical protein [Candidatus Woesearchaeota archaeon]
MQQRKSEDFLVASASLQQQLIQKLQQADAYPHPTAQIKTITTAASHVFLTGSFAYKINKPLNLGFLDFSTLEKRKEQCEKEVKHNSLISPELYLGVVSITQDGEGNVKIGGSGTAVEYAVKMKQMPPEATMDNLLKTGKVDLPQIRLLAKKIFQFHQKAPTNDEISSFGNEKSIQFNWDENFQQTEKYRPELISSDDFVFMQRKINNFIQNNKALFQQRVEKNAIKHCHGDFHSANVFLTEKEMFIFDSIVFNQRFPCSDMVAEIAFMAMDLDFHHREDLAQQFIEEYQRLSGDADVPLLLDFYKCYRAYIRAKIACFTSEDNSLSVDERELQKEKAKQYFSLAKKYSEKL